MGDEDQVNGVVTEENGGTEVAEAAPEQTEVVPEQTEEASPEKTESAPEQTEEASPEKTEAAPEQTEEASPEKTEAAPEQTEEASPEQTDEASPEKTESASEKTEEASPEKTEPAPEQTEEASPGQAEQAPEKESVVTETEKPIEEPNKNVKTVANILHRVKEDTEMSSEQKIDTLSMLLTKFVAENGVLKNEVNIIMDNMKKHIEHKETLKMMNEALKRQMDLVKEECELRVKEVMTKRQECQNGYSDTMGELSTLLETQSGQNNQLLTENNELSKHMGALLEEAQKREAQFETVQTELQLQLKLLEAQMKKAQLEKAELKCEMTQERMEIAQELNLERDRSINLERTISLLREQIDVYEKQSNELSAGTQNHAKQFTHFKSQIDKLTQNMTTLEKETAQWREKSELSHKQVQKMNQVTMEKDQDLTTLKKKLEGMVKLNQALTNERSELMNKIKDMEAANEVSPDH